MTMAALGGMGLLLIALVDGWLTASRDPDPEDLAGDDEPEHPLPVSLHPVHADDPSPDHTDPERAAPAAVTARLVNDAGGGTSAARRRDPRRSKEQEAGRHRPQGGVDAAALLTAYVCLLWFIPSPMVVSALGSAGSPATLFGIGLFLYWAWHTVRRTEQSDGRSTRSGQR